jgi:hypothetical protein
MDLNSSAVERLTLCSQRSLSVMCRALVMLAVRILPVITPPRETRVATNDINAPLGIGDLWFRRTGCVHSANTSSLGCFCARKPGLSHRGRTYGHSSCLCLLLIELNPFSSRRTGIEKDHSPFLFCFYFGLVSETRNLADIRTHHQRRHCDHHRQLEVRP